jgi:AraC-like DNA-binding protein
VKNRSLPALLRLVAPIAEPDDYFNGLRRPAEALPDNVLLFTRREAYDLRPASVSSAFHQRWVLIVALIGKGTVVLDHAPFVLKARHALLVPPLHLHAYEKVTAQPTWLFITFEWPGHTALGEHWRQPHALHPEAVERLRALIAAWSAPQPDGLATAAHLLSLLRLLSPKTETSRAKPTASSATGLIAAVRAAAESAPNDKLRSLAARVGLSESHLRARFRREAGISLGRYLREARLRQAAIWLREENLSVKAAAERAGYPDIYTFSRAFSRALGAPPSTLRVKTR